MYSSSVHNLPSIYKFEHAERIFNTTKKPRSARWSEHQRPLKDTRSTHYRLEKGQSPKGVYYDAILYQTAMARYYEPAPDGTRVALFTHHSSTLSKQFMWSVLGNSPQMLSASTADGVKIALPYNAAQTIKEGSRSFNVMVTTDADNNLLIDKSWHPQMYRPVELEHDRVARRAFEKELDSILLLAAMRLSEYEAGFEQQKYVKAFSSVETTANIDFSEGITQQFINNVFTLGQDVYDYLRSKRNFNAGGPQPHYDWQTRTHISPRTSELVGEPITQADLMKALKGHIVKRVGAKKLNGAKPLPKWMPLDEYPSSVATGWISGRVVVE